MLRAPNSPFCRAPAEIGSLRWFLAATCYGERDVREHLVPHDNSGDDFVEPFCQSVGLRMVRSGMSKASGAMPNNLLGQLSK